MQSTVDSISDLIFTAFGEKADSFEFNLYIAVCLCTWVIVSRLLFGIFRVQKGVFIAFFSLILFLFLGLMAYGFTDVYAVPLVESQLLKDFLPLLAMLGAIFMAIILLSKRMFSESASVLVLIFIIATGASVGALFVTKISLGVVEMGGGSLEERDRSVKDEIDSLL